MQRPGVVDRRHAVGVQPRLGRLAQQGRARRAGVERPQRHQGGVGLRRPHRQEVHERHHRREGQGGGNRHGPPALASVEVTPAVDRPRIRAGRRTRGRAGGCSAAPGGRRGPAPRPARPRSDGRGAAHPDSYHPPHANRRPTAGPWDLWHHGGARGRVGGDGLGTQVSVVLPAYNEAENLVEVIPDDHGRPATPRALTFEILVVDDGSTDGTRRRHARPARAPTSLTSACGATRASPRRSGRARPRRGRVRRADGCRRPGRPDRDPQDARQARGEARPRHRPPGGPQRPVHQAQHLQDLQRGHLAWSPASREGLQLRLQAHEPRAGRHAWRCTASCTGTSRCWPSGTASRSARSTSSTTSGSTARRSSAGPASGAASSTW